MKNAVIVGRGPAGISAALYTRRAGLATTVVAKDDGALGRAEIIENYYGFAGPVSGRALNYGLFKPKSFEMRYWLWQRITRRFSQKVK